MLIPLALSNLLWISRAGQATMGEAALARSTGKPITVMAAPVLAPSGKIAGIMGISVKLDYLQELIASKRIGASGYAFVVNSLGLLVAHPDGSSLLKDTLGRAQGMQALSSARTSGRTGSRKACGVLSAI